MPSSTLDRVLDDYHDALARGDRPDLSSLLKDPTGNTTLLIELVHAELEHRWKHGERPLVEEYLKRFPHLAESPTAVVELVLAEHRFRTRQDEHVPVEQYLERFPSLAATLAPLLTPHADTDTQPATDVHHEPPVLPGFEIYSELGRGGMGVVYKARQLSLNRLVAVKVVLAGAHASSEERLRFRIEAEVAANLDHPNIVRLHEVGEHQGQPYLVLEYVEGQTLDRVCRADAAGELTPTRAAELVEFLAGAVHHAHTHGVIHRDLKPRNILVAADGRPRITDFGLARRLTGGSSHDLTTTGQVLGTPAYMAPEQTLGMKSVGPGSDLYALGAILYECLTGQPPFTGRSAFEVMRQVLESPPVSPRQIRRDVPRDLEVICLKCLAKAPGERYQTAGELADDLGRFRHDEPIFARPAPLLERAVKWVRRRPAAALAALAAMLVVASGIAGLVVHYTRLADALGQADDARLRAEQERYAAVMSAATQFFRQGDVVALNRKLASYTAVLDDVDLRGFEWHYLNQHGQSLESFLADERARPANLVGYTTDGRGLITACSLTGREFSTPCQLKVWDRSTRKVRFSLPMYVGAPVNAINMACSPDGRWIALCPDPRTLAVHDAANGKRLASRRFPNEIWTVLFVGDKLLVVQASHVAEEWDWRTDQIRRFAIPDLHPHCGRSLAFHNRRLVITGDGGYNGKEVNLYDLELLRQIGTLRYPPAQTATILTAASRNPWFAIGRLDGVVQVCNDDGHPLAELAGHPAVVRALVFSPDERLLASGCEDGSVLLWETGPSWKLRATLRWQLSPVRSLAFSPDGREIAVGTESAMVYCLRADARHRPVELRSNIEPAGPVALSPRGDLLAAAVLDGSVILLDVPALTKRHVLPGDGGPVRALTFSPDARLLAAASGSRARVRLWDVRSGRPRLLHDPDGHLTASMEFSPDGRWLATVGAGPVRLWDVATGRPLRSWKPPRTNLTGVAFRADGKKLATLAADGQICVWHLSEHTSGPALETSWDTDGTGQRLAWTPDQKALVMSGWGSWHWWDLTGDQPRSGPRHPVTWHDHQSIPDSGSRILTHFYDQWCFVDARTGTGRWFVWLPLRPPNGIAPGCALSQNEHWLAAVGTDRQLRLWDTRRWQMHFPFGPVLGPVRSLAFSPDGHEVVCGASLGPSGGRTRISLNPLGVKPTGRVAWSPALDAGTLVHRWDSATSQRCSSLERAPTVAAPEFVAVSPDGKTIAAGGNDGRIWWWSRTGRLLRQTFFTEAARKYALAQEEIREWNIGTPALKYKENMLSLSFTPDGQALAALSRSGNVVLWDTATGTERGRLPDANAQRLWLCISPDSRTLTLGVGGAVEHWDIPTHQLQTTLGNRSDAPLLCGAYSPRGDWLAVGTQDQKVRVWDVRQGRETATLPGHLDAVQALAFSPDGKSLASGSSDRTVRLWNVATWQEVLSLHGHQGKVTALAFSPDSLTLASGGEIEGASGQVLLWRARPLH